MFKVKILYIPTGEFLISNGITSIYWSFDKYSCPSIEFLLEEILSVNKNKYSGWAIRNNISLPLLREELEIIYD